MTSKSPDKSRSNLIDEFLSFIKRIAWELVEEDIEKAIVLIAEKIPKEKLSNIQTGEQLVSCLKAYYLLSENNLDYFIKLLQKIRGDEFANRVKEYQKKSVHTVRNASPAQITERIPARNMESLFLVMAGQPSSITVVRLDHIKESICRALGLEKSEIFYVATENDEDNPDYYQLHLQMPEIEEKINQLELQAVKKEPWLTDLEVVELKVGKNLSIVIAEKKKGGIKKKSMNGEKQSRTPMTRMHSVLGVDPTLKIHCDHTFDTVLVIELPPTVDRKKLKTVLEQCESAVKIYDSHDKDLSDVRLAAIRFGNHSPVPGGLAGQQQIAFLDKELSHDIKIMSNIKPNATCGGSMNSGLADALNKVYSMKDDMRREATKLSIVICFLTKNSTNLEHYRCSFGHDIIRLGHSLATHAVPLYIIGIDLEGTQSHTQENYLLSGLTAISGGRYFQIQDISLLKELIPCIIKENNSIERNMGTANDVVITEINKQYGDVNEVHLTQCLHERLRLCSCKIDCITQKGMPLTPISQISERVSWADNLDDAIAGVKSLKKHMKEADKVPVPSKQVPMMPKQSSASPSKTTKGKKKPGKKQEEPKEFVYVSQNPDPEVSARMVRRQDERSAYYRPAR